MELLSAIFHCWFNLLLQCHDRHDSVVNTYVSYSEGPGFKCRGRLTEI